MPQEYDKIFKENFEEFIATLARKLLKINPEILEEIPDDIHYTTEKKPDFLKRVIGDYPDSDSILHIEVQSTDPKKMIRRMLIYYGFLYHDYGLEVNQYVLYIGPKEESTLPTYLRHKNLKFKFHLLNIQDQDHEIFLNSNKPEDIILAILCDFNEKSPELIIDEILAKLKKVTNGDELEIGKFHKQLEILSKLRNLQEITTKKVGQMPIAYDLETDIRFLQGVEKGVERGKKMEREATIQKRKKTLIASIKNLQSEFPELSNQKIAAILGISMPKLEKLLKEIKK